MSDSTETYTPSASYSLMMSDPTRPPRVGRRQSASSSPAVLRHHQRLPDDLLRNASRRLGIIALLAAALWTLAALLGRIAYHNLYPADTNWLSLRVNDAISLVSVLASLALYSYTRRPARNPAFVLDLGLAYQVYTALALGFVSHSLALPLGSAAPEVSWAGVVILITASLVPNDPTKVLIAGIIAASMNPLGMVVLQTRAGQDVGATVANALLMHYPDYLLVGAAVVISSVMTRLGQQVTKAREMGSYQLGELLGSGGMGEVYRATHRMLARPAAIKLMRPAMTDDLQRNAVELAEARFRREAEAAARLRSPHTVELYDFGITDDGTMYFVMELLDGLDLESLVRQYGALPPNRTVFLLRQICESLEEAHVLGLVHRDIKPANIHVGRLGLNYDFVKVLDFGLVKQIASASDNQLLATAAGLTPGTPSYMAPEVTLGEEYDGRADLYAVGCVAYFLLTGAVVFEGFDAMQIAAKHVRTQPIAPSRRASQYVPATLDTAVLACLAKNPEDRPRDAAALSRMLAAIDIEPWTERHAEAWWKGIED